ncbi:hypothetical protein [Deinococcus humi]|uniref:Lipoprotein n=1 Tax=Deinococcus humi TaxID=662880 RepID=A0A7W8JVN4_9DEIO|nr:hypothetical protein [Deinococcus humi]MBB5363668.1 hypothetical protein [Deinococcus humi]GGO29846.1 hypothetical protein GCM10008949_23900 [Deinococcus humi]
MKDKGFSVAGLVSVLVLTACGDRAEDLGWLPPPTPNGCAIHLFAAPAFQQNAANDIIEGAGKFSNLKTLPGATKNWTDQVKSILIGRKAIIQTWEMENFQGATNIYKESEFAPDVSTFNSMQVDCFN